MKLLLHIVITVFCLDTLGCEYLTSRNQRPIIKYKEKEQHHLDQIQKRANESLHLDCFADYPVKWLIPPDNSMYEGYSNPKERLTIHTQNNGYHATLRLSQLQWTDTGFYRCVPEDFDETIKIQKELADEENRVHIYVSDSDKNHLFLHLNIDMINLAIDEVSYINCLVTDVSATVELYDDNSRKFNNLLYEDGFGFQLQPGALERLCKGGNGPFCKVFCKTKSIDGSSDELPILLFGERKTNISISPNNIEDMFYVGNNLTMTCSAIIENSICKWEGPKGRKIKRSQTVSLSLINIDESNQGTYKCTCMDKTGKHISKEKHFYLRDYPTKSGITLLNGRSAKTEEIDEFGNATFLVKVRVVVRPEDLRDKSGNLSYRWYRRYSTVQGGQVEEEVFNTDTFLMKNTEQINGRSIENNEILVNSITLKKASANHSGDYILTVRLFQLIYNYTFSLTVLAPPKPKLIVTESFPLKEVNPKYLEYTKTYEIWCINEGYPKRKPILIFKPCIDYILNSDKSEKCVWRNVQEDQSYDQNTNYVSEKNGTFQRAVVAHTIASRSGTYKCLTSLKGAVVTIHYMVSDVNDSQTNEGFVIKPVNIDTRTTVVSNSAISIYEDTQTLKLLCKVQKYANQSVHWFYNSSNGIETKLESTVDASSQFSMQSMLILENITPAEDGKYSCITRRTVKDQQEILERSVDVKVLETKYPFFGNDTSKQQADFTLDSEDYIFCDSRGDPAPIIHWYKDDIPFNEFCRAGITLEKERRELRIVGIQPTDKGIYSCRLSNYFNDDIKSYEFERDVINVPLDLPTIGLAGAISFLGSVVVALIIALLAAQMKYRKKIKKLQLIHNSFIASANQTPKYVLQEDKPINEQPECLAYNIDFELPQKLIPCKDAPVLGSGQFGRVVSINIEIPFQYEQYPAAVKCISTEKILPEEVESVLAEVKIMIYIGEHVNILPLIGSISAHLHTRTRNLYIFTEHCRWGSLDKLLRKCRDTDAYYDELHSVTVTPQASITYEHPTDRTGYIVPHFENDSEPSTTDELQSLYHQSSTGTEQNFNGYTVPPPLCNVNHISHNEGNSAPPTNNLCTSDLLFYCYQIVNGMLFLFSKKVIHRDLATRNILVTENNVVRISDFGLSQNGNDYKIKNLNRKLPTAWLALEVHTEQRFSTFSDIWSFGVVMWEIFSLGQIPYSGLSRENNDIYKYLKSGRRLPKPGYAPDSIWNLMQQCWSANPKHRPSYKQCEEVIGEELKRSCRQCYDRVQFLLTDPRNKPNYDNLRKQLIDMKDAIDDGYEVPKNKNKTKGRVNRYYPSLQRGKGAGVSLLAI